jgi:hypothetical protein
MMPVNTIVCPQCREAGEEKPRKILLFIRAFCNRSFFAAPWPVQIGVRGHHRVGGCGVRSGQPIIRAERYDDGI